MTAEESNTQPARRSVSNASLWAGRVLSALVVLFMLFDGSNKLVPLGIVTESATQLGLPASASFARGLGIVGLACTALYLFPRTTVLGAILLTAYSVSREEGFTRHTVGS